MNFQTPTEDGYSVANNGRPNLAAFLSKNSPGALRPITQGMFGYSIIKPIASKEYFNNIFDASVKFGCNLEVWHTESGPGVFEAVISPLLTVIGASFN